MKPPKVNLTQADLYQMVQKRVDAMKGPQMPNDPLAKMKVAIAKVKRI